MDSSNDQMLDCLLLYRQECFSGKYTTRKFHTKLHPGLEWRIFHILTSEDIADVITPLLHSLLCKNTLVYIIKRKLHGGLKPLYSWRIHGVHSDEYIPYLID